MTEPAAELEAPPGSSGGGATPLRPTRVRIAMRSLLGILVGLGLAIGVAWIAGVKPDSLVENLRAVSPLAIAGCAASSLVIISLQGLRWRATTHPLLGLRYVDALRIHAATAMLNGILPARGGDILKIEFLSRRKAIPRARLVGTEIVDRWLDFSGWIPAFVLVCVFGDPPAWLVKPLAAVAGGILLWAGAMMFLSHRGYAPNPSSRTGRIWVALGAGIRTFRSPRIAWIALTLAPLPWLWETWVIAEAARAFGLELTLVMAFSVLMAFNVAMAIPSPAAMGTIEAAGLGALTFYGFDPSRALAFMASYHLAQLVPAVIAGMSVFALGGKDFLRNNPTENSEMRAASAVRG